MYASFCFVLMPRLLSVVPKLLYPRCATVYKWQRSFGATDTVEDSFEVMQDSVKLQGCRLEYAVCGSIDEVRNLCCVANVMNLPVVGSDAPWRLGLTTDFSE